MNISDIGTKGVNILFQMEITQYGFFGSNIDISAIHGPIVDNRYFQNIKILLSASLSKNIMYSMPYYF